MNNPYSNPDTRPAPSNLGESGAKVATEALGDAHRQADKALDDMAHGTEDLLLNAGTAIDHASDRAAELTRRGSAAVRRAAQQLREGADRASTQAVGYVKDEPIRALLMAAAVGAALAAVLSMVTQSRRRY